MWGSDPLPDARLYCISDRWTATYSGMLPGVLAGQYREEQMHIDLVRLCAAAGGTLIVDEVTGLHLPDPADPDGQAAVLFRSRAPLPFDVLSIGIGSVSTVTATTAGMTLPLAETDPSSPRNGPCADEPSDIRPDCRGTGRAVVDPGAPCVTIKPIADFPGRLRARLLDLREQPTGQPLQVAVVGGGAAGVEILCCLPRFVERVLGKFAVQYHLIDAGPEILTDASAAARRLVAMELHRRGVSLWLGRRVVHMARDRLLLEATDGVRPGGKAAGKPADGSRSMPVTCELPVDLVVWCGGAAAPPLLAALGLPTDAAGFLLTEATLQTVAGWPIFAVGDTGTSSKWPHRKAGVYAVRQGPVLWRNLRRLLRGESLEPYRPQSEFLRLINTGDGRAIADFRGWATSGRWIYWWKDHIDTRFIRQYQELSAMRASGHQGAIAAPAARAESTGADETPAEIGGVVAAAGPARVGAVMPCRGCGGKVSPVVLSRVLRKLQVPTSPSVLIGLESPDDAAVVVPPRMWTAGSPETPGSPPIVVTTDFFTLPVEDEFVAGRLAAVNAVSDAYAMGAVPYAAVAHCVIPRGAAEAQERVLGQLLSGALQVFEELEVSLVGGHSVEGAESMLGFTILASPRRLPVCALGNGRAGDVLLLTKPLGIGVLLAAGMRGLCRAEWYATLLQAMLASPAPCAERAVTLGVECMTDVTGFGLAGHLHGLLAASHLSCELELNAIPVLPGALELLAGNIDGALAARPERRHRARRGDGPPSAPDRPRAVVESTMAPRNREAFAPCLEVRPPQQHSPRLDLLFDPQTGGGLLIAIAPEQVQSLQRRNPPEEQRSARSDRGGLPAAPGPSCSSTGEAVVIGRLITPRGAAGTIHLV
jgi:selenide,water dikinase